MENLSDVYFVQNLLSLAFVYVSQLNSQFENYEINSTWKYLLISTDCSS